MGKPYKDFLSMHTVGESGCWNYTGTIGTRGYGQIKKTTAHRWYYEQLVGPVDSSLEVDHLCRNKTCVNPDHLEPVTPDENKARMTARPGRCRNGHPVPGKSLTILERGNPTYPTSACEPCIAWSESVRTEWAERTERNRMAAIARLHESNTLRKVLGLSPLTFVERP